VQDRVKKLGNLGFELGFWLNPRKAFEFEEKIRNKEELENEVEI